MRLLLKGETPETLSDLWLLYDASGSFAPNPYITLGYTKCDAYLVAGGGGGGGGGSGFGATTELLPNPGIEVDTTGWVNAVGATVTRTTAQHHSGVGALRATVNGTGGVEVEVKTSPRIPVVEGKTYVMSFWLRPTVGVTLPGLFVNWFNAAGVQIATSSFTSFGSTPINTWRQFTKSDCLAPAGAVSGEFHFGLDGSASDGVNVPPNGTIYDMDDFSVKATTPHGGGGGGAGGGGGFKQQLATLLASLAGTVPVTVGGGGPGGIENTQGTSGGNTVFNGVTAYGGGGGGGGADPSGTGAAGGAGGGGGGTTSVGTNGGNATSAGTAGGAAGGSGGGAGGNGASNTAAPTAGAAGSASGSGYGGGGGGGGGHGLAAVVDSTLAAGAVGGAGDASTGGAPLAPTGSSSNGWSGGAGGGGGSADLTSITTQSGLPGDGNAGTPGGGGAGARGGLNGPPLDSAGQPGAGGLLLLRIYA